MTSDTERPGPQALRQDTAAEHDEGHAVVHGQGDADGRDQNAAAAHDLTEAQQDVQQDAQQDARQDARRDAQQVERLRALLGAVRVALFDFDGPICRLFAGHRAEQVAAGLITWVTEYGLHELLSEDERRSTDPHLVLRAVDARQPHGDLVEELEERMTQEELRAAASAWPTPYVDPLIRTWNAMGARLAVVTNHSPRAVRDYLTGRGLLQCFEAGVYGRTRNLDQLKPDPYSLRRALTATGVAPAHALMIGDDASDFAAARAAGVPFLGYARDARKAELLDDAGASVTVGSLELVLRALRPHTP